METRQCTCCGQERPVTDFKKIGQPDGKTHYLTVCSDCMREKQRKGREKAKAKRLQETRAKESVTDARKLRIHDFSPRELMEELYRRGYEGTLRYVEVHEIDIAKLDC